MQIKIKTPPQPLTLAQEEWLCEVLGSWYFAWKDNMTPNSAVHNLGRAHAHLVDMLCPICHDMVWDLPYEKHELIYNYPEEKRLEKYLNDKTDRKKLKDFIQ